MGGHMQEHAKVKKHFLGNSFMYLETVLSYESFISLSVKIKLIIFVAAMELTYGTVMCFHCGDYVYDKDFSGIAMKRDAESAKERGVYLAYHSWQPNYQDVEALRNNPQRRQILENTTIGEIIKYFTYNGQQYMSCKCMFSVIDGRKFYNNLHLGLTLIRVKTKSFISNFFSVGLNVAVYFVISNVLCNI